MGCTLDRFTRYDLAEVLHTNGRVVARLSSPPTGCPDGTLNNSHTIEQESATVLRPTLVFDQSRGVPVVLVPGGYKPAAPAPDGDVQHGLGWFVWILLIGCAVAAVCGFVVLMRRPKEPPQPDHEYRSPTPSGGSGSGYGTATVIHTYNAPRAHHSTGDMLASGLVGYELGKLSSGHASSPAPTPAAAPSAPTTYSSDPSPSSSDSSSSYSSDSGSSYSSDSSSSFGSDSSSSFGSDSGSSFGSD